MPTGFSNGTVNTQFYEDLGLSGHQLEGFFYILAVSESALESRIAQVIDKSLTPSDTATEMSSKSNLMIMIKDSTLYNNPWLAIFYKVDDTFKVLTRYSFTGNISILNKTKFVFYIDLESTIINCDLKLNKNDIIFRHYHKKNGTNPVILQSELGVNQYKSQPKNRYNRLIPTRGTTQDILEYYPISDFHVIKLNRRNVPDLTYDRDIGLNPEVTPTPIILTSSNGVKDARYLDSTTYFDYLYKKYISDLKSDSIVSPRSILKFRIEYGKGFYIRLDIVGIEYPNTYLGYIILNTQGGYSNASAPLFKRVENILYVSSMGFYVYKISAHRATYLGTEDYSGEFDSGILVNDQGKILIDPVTPQSVDFSQVFEGRSPFSLIYSEGMPEEYRAYAGIHSTKHLVIESDDISNGFVSMDALRSRYGVINHTYNLVITIDSSIKSVSQSIKLKLYNNRSIVTVIADYGRMIELYDTNGATKLGEVRNSVYTFIYFSDSLNLIEAINPYPLFMYTFSNEVQTVFGSKLGLFPDLTKYWIRIKDGNSIIAEGIPSSMSDTYMSDTNLVRIQFTLGVTTYWFFNKRTSQGNIFIQDSDIYVNKVEFNIGFLSTDAVSTNPYTNKVSEQT